MRVRDLEASLDFYVNKLGLVESHRVDNAAGRFSLIFLCAPEDLETARKNQAPCVELTHNWDPEDYDGGRNFGHLAYEVENVFTACQRLMDMGVTINPFGQATAGWRLVRSPDNISIELLQRGDPPPPAEPWTSMPNAGVW